MIFQLFVGIAAACEDLDPWSDERFDAQRRVEVSREDATLKFSCYHDQKYPSYNGGKVLNEIQAGVKVFYLRTNIKESKCSVSLK